MGYPDKIFYEPQALEYDLGKKLYKKYEALEWIPIENHNNIPILRKNPNSEFVSMKNHLVIGIRKTHRYVENHKVSDFLVPYTSSGCGAMCLYCYLVCNYNKCAYLRLFVNREEMLQRLIRTANNKGRELCFEIGSNSDLVFENKLTGNLSWTIENFAKAAKGKLTFPTKFSMVDELCTLTHNEKVIFRMSLNPEKLIREIELKTSPLKSRVEAVNKMCEAGYPVGILLAPIIITEEFEKLYGEFFSYLADTLSEKVKTNGFIEIIFMTYSYVQNEINKEAFKDRRVLLSKEQMTGRGRGKYCYRPELREKSEAFIKKELLKKLPEMKILYIV